ncbi:TrmH family RNA methyltransferase [Balneola sp. MJW-20]|uniref:TrmH family RNA methyltransferase n=1 Tax=Gracilimonas aurantiaca TaxID=3234185 RepID=UPI003467EA6C
MAKLTTKQILNQNLSRKTPSALRDLKLIVHNIRSMHNVGSVFRSADAFGVGEIIISGYSPVPPRPEISKTAIGAEEFVKWKYVDEIDTYLSEMKKRSYRVIGLEQTTHSIALPEIKISGSDKLILVLGNEVTGIDDEIMRLIDEFVLIPQFGHKHSLNVSVAAGVMLYGVLSKVWQDN